MLKALARRRSGAASKKIDSNTNNLSIGTQNKTQELEPNEVFLLRKERRRRRPVALGRNLGRVVLFRVFRRRNNANNNPKRRRRNPQ